MSVRSACLLIGYYRLAHAKCLFPGFNGFVPLVSFVCDVDMLINCVFHLVHSLSCSPVAANRELAGGAWIEVVFLSTGGIHIVFRSER